MANHTWQSKDRSFSSTDADLIFAKVVPKAPLSVPSAFAPAVSARDKDESQSQSSRRWLGKAGGFADATRAGLFLSVAFRARLRSQVVEDEVSSSGRSSTGLLL